MAALYLSGTVVNNPSTQSAICLSLSFKDFGYTDQPILYPQLEYIIEYAASKKASGDLSRRVSLSMVSLTYLLFTLLQSTYV